MKAITLSEYGGIENLVFADVPKPEVADDEVRIHVKYTAVNHLELAEASGAAKQFYPITLPWIPGHEFSGIVEAVGEQVTDFRAGDAVFGDSPSGAYAEFLVLKPGTFVKKPANLSFEEAASVPVAAQTAWQGLFTYGHLTKGQTVLIHGAAGAVGAYAVQFAHHTGARVIATATGIDADFLTSIGADQVVDYQAVPFENELTEKVDLVFDVIGGDVQHRSYAVLKAGGYLIATSQPPAKEEAAKHKVTALMMNMVPSAEGLAEIAKLLEDNKVKANVAKTYPLNQAAEAWTAISQNLPVGNSGETVKNKHGKLVLEIA